MLTSQVALRRICFLPPCIALVYWAADSGRLFIPPVGSHQLLLDTQWCSTAHPEHCWCMEAIGRQLRGALCNVFLFSSTFCLYICFFFNNPKQIIVLINIHRSLFFSGLAWEWTTQTYFTWTGGSGHLSVLVSQQQAQEREPSIPPLSLETTWLFMVGIYKMSIIIIDIKTQIFIWLWLRANYDCLPSGSPPGGNVHIHYQEEKCFDEEIFFYHLGCHQWVSVGERWSLSEFWPASSLSLSRNRGSALCLEASNSLLLPQVGFPLEGVTLTLLLSWKTECCWWLEVTVALPAAIWLHTKFHFLSVVIKVTGWVSTRKTGIPPDERSDGLVMSWVCMCVCVFHQDAFCAEALDESMCLKNPACSWCEGRCREYQPTNPVKPAFIFRTSMIKGWITQSSKRIILIIRSFWGKTMQQNSLQYF